MQPRGTKTQRTEAERKAYLFRGKSDGKIVPLWKSKTQIMRDELGEDFDNEKDEI